MKITGIYYFSLAQIAQKGLKNGNGDRNGDVAVSVAIAIIRRQEVAGATLSTEWRQKTTIE